MVSHIELNWNAYAKRNSYIYSRCDKTQLNQLNEYSYHTSLYIAGGCGQ